MKLKQIDFERIREQVRNGELTPEQANVEMVRVQRVKLVTARMPAEVRKALNDAVKRGELKHIKKDGHKPEAYYHPTFEYLVPGERNDHEQRCLRALAGVFA